MSEPLGRPERLILHWTAGFYGQVFHDYHFCVRGDGQVVNTLPLAQKGAHTWKRNGGAIGLAFCAMAKGCPVLPAQREAMAKAIAELCLQYDIPMEGKVQLPRLHLVGEQLLPAGGTVLAPRVTDHAWYARADGYFPERWDIGDELGPVLKKAAWYLAELRAGRQKPEHTRRGR